MSDNWHVRVQFANGDDFTKQYVSHVDVQAKDAKEARLLGEQMAHTPQPGKPDHMQITRTEAQFQHVCNSDPSQGPVCSHLVTDDQLTSMGHPVKAIGKGPVGTTYVEREGEQREKAVMSAWRGGNVRICTRSNATEPTDPRNREQFS